jgi:tetratricopeptide (TPR) repeat protein
MSESHSTVSVLESLQRGELSRLEEQELQEHLLLCKRCRALAERVLAAGPTSSEAASASEDCGSTPQAGYSKVLDSVFEDIIKENCQLEAQRAEAPHLVLELCGLPSGQRELLILNSPRYKVWPLAEQLLAACRSGWGQDPSSSEELAHLALKIAIGLDVSGFRRQLLNDLIAEAWSYIGNCRRVQSDLREASKAFTTAEGYLAQGSGDAMEFARLLDLKASLLRAERDFDGATSILARAIEIYRRAREWHLEGRALLKQAKILGDSGRVEGAVSVMERAAKLLDSQREPRVLLLLKWNLASYLTTLGKLEQAQALLLEVRELVRMYGSRHDRLRVLWVEGVLRSQLGQPDLAVEALKQVREGFIAENIGYDVALVSLDLATLYLEAGRTNEVRKLAAESVPLFASRGVHRELMMAWTLFREAAERDAVTLGLVKEVASRIRHAQAHPDETSDTP